MASNKTKVVGGTIVAVAAGYVLGILTAPRSGKSTRKQIATKANEAVTQIEKQLKDMYKQSQEMIDKFNKDNPKMSQGLKDLKAKAIACQEKIKELLTSIHGDDSTEEDLHKAVSEAQKSLDSINKTLKA